MTECNFRFDRVSGLFKVRDAKIEDVLALVAEWRASSSGDRFLHLAVRDGGKEKKTEKPLVAIDVLFDLQCDSNGSQEAHGAFFHKYTDQLRRRFGNGLAVWDVSTPVWIVS